METPRELPLTIALSQIKCQVLKGVGVEDSKYGQAGWRGRAVDGVLWEAFLRHFPDKTAFWDFTYHLPGGSAWSVGFSNRLLACVF